MWIAFPFASIANRPEISLGSQIITNMPLFFMYAQFPIEGLMARFALRGHVTFLRVLGQVLFSALVRDGRTLAGKFPAGQVTFRTNQCTQLEFVCLAGITWLGSLNVIPPQSPRPRHGPFLPGREES